VVTLVPNKITSDSLINECFRWNRAVYSKLQLLFDSADVANSMRGMCLAKTIVNLNYQ